MRYIKGFISMIPEIKRRVKQEKVGSVEFENEVIIEIQTGSYRTTRGYTVVTAICDEIAYWYTDQRAVNGDKEIIRA